MEHKKSTALLVFSLSAQKESERKTFFGKHRKREDTAFFDLLIRKTEDLALRSGIDVFWMDESRQSGTSFSEKFANAFQDRFDHGYENVVSIGNDCPDLTLDVLQGAIAGLNDKKMVMGPSTDGGVYLLALHKTAFDRSRFLALPWQTSGLASGLRRYATSLDMGFDLLDPLSDLDTYDDLRRYSRTRPLTRIGRLFKAIADRKKDSFRILDDRAPSSSGQLHIGLRAPPSY